MLLNPGLVNMIKDNFDPAEDSAPLQRLGYTFNLIVGPCPSYKK